MSRKTKDFLIKLGEDPDTRARFREDPRAVMREHGVPDDHQELIVNGDKEGLKKKADLDEAHVNLFIF